jgi:hypothetical protein
MVSANSDKVLMAFVMPTGEAEPQLPKLIKVLIDAAGSVEVANLSNDEIALVFLGLGCAAAKAQIATRGICNGDIDKSGL